jgi:hypothetical protein
MTGTCRRVLRLLSTGLLLAVVVAGCGGGSGTQRSADHGVPRALAQRWESRASAIANAASAGDDCTALRRASSLRDDVVATQHSVPVRLRSPLLIGVNALAARLKCTPPPATKPPTQPKPPKPPHDKHERHGHHGHPKHGGDGNDQ